MGGFLWAAPEALLKALSLSLLCLRAPGVHFLLGFQGCGREGIFSSCAGWENCCWASSCVTWEGAYPSFGLHLTISETLRAKEEEANLESNKDSMDQSGCPWSRGLLSQFCRALRGMGCSFRSPQDLSRSHSLVYGSLCWDVCLSVPLSCPRVPLSIPLHLCSFGQAAATWLG